MPTNGPNSSRNLTLTPAVGAPGTDSGIAFLTDALLLISNGRPSPTSVLYDIQKEKVTRTGVTCALTGKGVWATAEGKLLSACPDGLVLYDQEFRQIAKFQTHLDYYLLSNTLILSPTHEFVAFDPLPRQGVAKVLSAATLTEVATFPSASSGLVGLYKAGYTIETSLNEKDGMELSFYSFLNSKTDTTNQEQQEL